MVSGAMIFGLIDSSSSLINGILDESASIKFDKGGQYGIAFAAPVMFTWGMLVLLIKGKATEKQENVMSRVIIVSLVLMFTYPHVVHFATSKYLSNKGYSKCEPVSRRWMHNVTIVYTSNIGECERLAAERK